MFPSSAAACRKVCRQVLGSLRRAPLGGSRCDDVVRCRLGHQAGAEHCMVFCAQRHVFWQLQKLNRAASSESDGGQGFGNAPSTWTFDHSARIVHTTPSGNDAPRLQPLTSATETGSLVARRQKLRVSRCACKLAASQIPRKRCSCRLPPPPPLPAPAVAAACLLPACSDPVPLFRGAAMAGVVRGLLGIPLRLVRAPVGFIVLLVGARRRRTFALPVRVWP